MKTKIINKVEPKEINWDKVNLVQSSVYGCIVLTNGEHNETDFSGTIIMPGRTGESIGYFLQTWYKRYFTLMTEPLTIEFNPE